MQKTVSSLLFACRNWFRKPLSTTWNMVLACLMWLVWQEHNTLTCEDIERPLDLLKSLPFGTLFQWACISGFMQCISISDFLQSVSFSSWIIGFCFMFSVHHLEHDVHFFQICEDRQWGWWFVFGISKWLGRRWVWILVTVDWSFWGLLAMGLNLWRFKWGSAIVWLLWLIWLRIWLGKEFMGVNGLIVAGNVFNRVA